jgi:hypothetical protein
MKTNCHMMSRSYNLQDSFKGRRNNGIVANNASQSILHSVMQAYFLSKGGDNSNHI